ncbi:MAG: VIT domain-containing protein [bacterium]
MKKCVTALSFIVACMMFFSVLSALAYTDSNNEKSLSPFFFVKSEDPSVDQLPLKATSAEINVAGVIADVIVTQVYKNEGRNPLEAIYIFPASTRAAVYGMKMTIGERTIVAKIREREQARQEYEEAKQQGKSASLLEQQRPNVFQMNVANILPGDVITVELKYTELLVPTDGIYEVVYPTVVGPRYSNQPQAEAPASEKWVENPYLHEGEKAPYKFDLTVNLSAGLPIQEVVCTTHKTTVSYDGPSQAVIKLDSSETAGGDRDFILKYRLTGGRIESGLLLYEGEGENFFLCMIQPPKRVRLSQIPPREYIFIVDVSGSMHGFPLDISKKLLKKLIGNLRSTDTFNVLLFAGSSSLMAERSLPATATNIQQAITLIEQQRGGGGTELLPALKRALALPHSEQCSRTVVIATDGYVTVEEEAFDLIRKNLGNANMFAFGIGSSVNRHIIEGMARVGMGEPSIITHPDQAEAQAERFRRIIETPVLTNIKIEFGQFNTYDVEPLSIPDLLAERPIVIFGKWQGTPQGSITVSGVAGDDVYRKESDVSLVQPSERNAALRYLWARHRIALLSDYNSLSQNDERVSEVTTLGLTYNLLTAYTSFIAVDSEIRLKNGQATTVKQPLPLPKGVSDYAVGTNVMHRSGFAPGPLPSIALQEKKDLSYNRMCSKSQITKEQSKLPEEKEEDSIQRGSVKLGKIVISGGFKKSDITQIIEKQIKGINKCVQKILDQHPSPAGEMIITFTINTKGNVVNVKVDKSTLQSEKIKNCILKAIKKLSFPKPTNGKETTISVSFHLGA